MPETRALISREFQRERRLLAAALALLVFLVLAVGWYGDHRSCQRSVPVRTYIIEDRAINLRAVSYWRAQHQPLIVRRLRERIQAEAKVRQLDCDQPLPGA